MTSYWEQMQTNPFKEEGYWRSNQSKEFSLFPFFEPRKRGTLLTILTVIILALATVAMGIAAAVLRAQRDKLKPAREDEYKRTELVVNRDTKVYELLKKMFSNNDLIKFIFAPLEGKKPSKLSKDLEGIDIMDTLAAANKTLRSITTLKQKMGEQKVGLGKNSINMFEYYFNNTDIDLAKVSTQKNSDPIINEFLTNAEMEDRKRVTADNSGASATSSSPGSGSITSSVASASAPASSLGSGTSSSALAKEIAARKEVMAEFQSGRVKVGPYTNYNGLIGNETPTSYISRNSAKMLNCTVDEWDWTGEYCD